MLKGGADTVHGHRKQFCISGTGTAEGSAKRRVARKKIFTFIIQSSGLALVPPLCFARTATVGLSLPHVLELAILWALLTVTVML